MSKFIEFNTGVNEIALIDKKRVTFLTVIKPSDRDIAVNGYVVSIGILNKAMWSPYFGTFEEAQNYLLEIKKQLED